MAHKIETSTHVDAAPAAVFTVMTDIAGAAERVSAIKRIEVLTEGPVGVGTRFRETRVMFGKEATEEMEIVELTPGEGYVLAAESCGFRYRTEVRAEPDGEGTRLVFGFHATPMTFMARVMGAVMAPLMRKTLVKACSKDLADIKQAVERGA